MSDAGFSGKIVSTKSNEAPLIYFDPFPILKPEKVSNNNAAINNNNDGYKNELVPSGSLMDTKREMTTTDLLDNFFVNYDQVTNKKIDSNKKGVSNNVRTLGVDWIGREIGKDLDAEYAKFFDKYEANVNHVKVSKLVDLADVEKPNTVSRDGDDIFCSLEDRPKVLVPHLDVLDSVKYNNFTIAKKDTRDLVHEIPENNYRKTEKIVLQGTDCKRQKEQYEYAGALEYKTTDYLKYSGDDIDDLVDELLHEKSFEKISISEKLGPETYSYRDDKVTQPNTVSPKINYIELQKEIKNTTKVTQPNTVSPKINYIELQKEIKNTTKDMVDSFLSREDSNMNNIVQSSKAVNKDTFVTQTRTLNNENLKKETTMSLNIREEKNLDGLTEYILKNSIVKENSNISNNKKDNIKLLDTVQKDMKKYAKCKHKLLTNEDKKKYTKALGLYQKSVVLPKIMERLNERKEKLNEEAKLQRRLVSDESVLKLLNTESNSPIKTHTLKNADGSSIVSLTTDSTNISAFTDCPNSKAQSRKELPPLSLEILKKNRNKERLLEFERRKLLREFVRYGIDLA